jgi:hypothetical protein
MALPRLLADPYTRSVLGRAGLEELSTNLWDGACQTCGKPLDDAPPAVQVAEGPTSITATLHHPECQRQRWTRRTGGAVSRYLTTSTELRFMPFGDPGTAPFLPTLLANPGLEEVTLGLDAEGQYRSTTVADFSAVGLAPPAGEINRVLRDDVRAWVIPEQLIVRCGRQYWVANGVTSEAAGEIERCGGVVLAVSSAIDPVKLRNPEPIKRILRTGAVALGFVPLDRTTAAPQLTGHSVRVETDTAGLDETDDTDWLPEIIPFAGPTFDPATGRFEIGLGMDGPQYWQLFGDDGRVRHGLIVGTPGIGKTSTARLVLAEAYASLMLDIAVISPLGDGGLVGSYGKIALSSAEDVESGVRLLERVAGLVRSRLTTPADYEHVDQQHPGIMVAIDDSAPVLADPVAAQAAEYVAEHGPTVGIALLVVATSVELDAYGHRPRLRRALLRGTVMPTNRELLAQVNAARDRDAE